MPPGFAIPTAWAGSRKTGALWTAVNERVELGSDLVPDYMTSVKDDFYGWPYSYYGQHVDPRVPAKPEMVAKAVVPDYALGNHTASLGLTFDTGSVCLTPTAAAPSSDSTDRGFPGLPAPKRPLPSLLSVSDRILRLPATDLLGLPATKSG